MGSRTNVVLQKASSSASQADYAPLYPRSFPLFVRLYTIQCMHTCAACMDASEAFEAMKMRSKRFYSVSPPSIYPPSKSLHPPSLSEKFTPSVLSLSALCCACACACGCAFACACACGLPQPRAAALSADVRMYVCTYVLPLNDDLADDDWIPTGAFTGPTKFTYRPNDVIVHLYLCKLPEMISFYPFPLPPTPPFTVMT
jgi:hypothetical protein